jgi:hypothetical protein
MLCIKNKHEPIIMGSGGRDMLEVPVIMTQCRTASVLQQPRLLVLTDFECCVCTLQRPHSVPCECRDQGLCIERLFVCLLTP